MNTLAASLEDYLALRRSVGFKLERAGKLLAQFVSYLEEANTEAVTIDLALSWATLPASGGDRWLSQRLSVVRGFAKYLRHVDERSEVPPAWLLPDRSHRATPFLYTTDEIVRIMAAAGTLPTPLRQVTFSTVVGLLHVSGMRVGEALRLDNDDVDLAQRVLLVRNSKFGKSREVPVHESTAAALAAYMTRRDELCATPCPALFVSLAGTRLRYDNFHAGWLRLVEEAGIASRSSSCRPRPHDMRHSFAVSSLVEAYRSGEDVEARLARLSTYLGHVNPKATYWYLSASPELLGEAAQRLEAEMGRR